MEVDRWFADAEAVCLICGAVSGNLEMLDFDLGGEAFEAWRQAVEAANPSLLARLVIEQSPPAAGTSSTAASRRSAEI